MRAYTDQLGESNAIQGEKGYILYLSVEIWLIVNLLWIRFMQLLATGCT